MPSMNMHTHARLLHSPLFCVYAGVFTSLIEDIGVKGVQVEELYSLDPEQFADLSPVHGLVFLFKYEAEHHSSHSAATDASTAATIAVDDCELFFAKQVISNACATQAILSILLNARGIELGETLSEFKAFTRDFPSDLKGLAISNSEPIRVSHNSFARPEPFVMEERRATKDDDVYHFIAYVPVNGKVYELDGLRDGPVCLGDVPSTTDGAETTDAWLRVACPVIQQRIEKYAASEIRFNLLALIRNRIDAFRSQLAALQAAPASETTDVEIAQLERAIADEQQKRAAWAVENARRKHNYLPFIVQLLKTLAEKQQLQPLVQQQQLAQNSSASAST